MVAKQISQRNLLRFLMAKVCKFRCKIISQVRKIKRKILGNLTLPVLISEEDRILT